MQNIITCNFTIKILTFLQQNVSTLISCKWRLKVNERLKSVFAYIKGVIVGIINENISVILVVIYINVILVVIYNQWGSEKGT
jgi:hypothetical protein